MRGSAKGFNGAKLREAREARGLNGVSLAGLVGISSATLSQWEHGVRTPRPEALQLVARQLNLPVAFFLEPDHATPSDPLFFRSQSAATKQARTREARRFQWHVRIEKYLREVAVLPPVQFPTLGGPRDPLSLSDEDIEEATREVRRFWALGDEPIPDMVELLERNGAIVVRCELGASSLDAYSGWHDGVPHVVLGTDKMSAVRSRFDAAHELAHLVLHRNLPVSVLGSSTGLKEIERQAQVFAGALLLPAESFAGDVIIPTLDSLLAIKPHWRTSVGAMIQRVHGLGIVSDDHHQRLWISYRRRWGRREPYDDELSIEQPRTLLAGFMLARRARRISAGAVRVSLPFSDGDIEELAGLPPGYLSELRDFHVTGAAEHPQDETGVLLQFPGRSQRPSS